MSAYKFDFFGNHNASTLDTIISLGKSGMNNLKAKNNYMAYDASLSEATGKRGLFNYLEGYRQLFLPDKSNNEWLKTNTKAYMVPRAVRVLKWLEKGNHTRHAVGFNQYSPNDYSRTYNNRHRKPF